MMTAAEYLDYSHSYLKKIIESKIQQVAVLQSLAEKASLAFGGPVVSHTHTRNVTAREDCIIAKEALQQEINRLLCFQQEAEEVISQVPNLTQCLILEKHYLAFMTWEEIGQDLGYTDRWVREQHRLALEVAQGILDERGVTVD